MHSTNIDQDKQTPLVVLKILCQTNSTPYPSNPLLATYKISSESSVESVEILKNSFLPNLVFECCSFCITHFYAPTQRFTQIVLCEMIIE